MLIGAASVAALNYYHPIIPGGWIPLGMAIGAGVLGALPPDIDHPNSTISHDLSIGRGDGCGFLIGSLLRILLGGHRGLTHTLVIVGLLLWLVLRFAQPWLMPYGLAFVTGYASHLVADLGHGVPLFWPLTDRHIKLWK